MLTLPKTSLVVHPLCLGGNVFGWSADEAQSFQVLDAYFDNAGNFIDTADVYSEWKDGNVGGESETIIGKWQRARKNREKIVIATKVSMLSTRKGLSAANIAAACDDSLRRLQSDYIDIYYAHVDDPDVPQEETLAAFNELVLAGKVRYIAASQHKPDRLRSALEISKRENYASYIGLQDHYNLMERTAYEGGQSEVVGEFGISMLPFFSLARGFLSGKYRKGESVESVRSGGVAAYQNDKGWAVIAALDEIANEIGCSISAVALAWLRAQPHVSTPLASARTVEQVREITQVIDLSKDQLKILDEITE